MGFASDATNKYTDLLGSRCLTDSVVGTSTKWQHAHPDCLATWKMQYLLEISTYLSIYILD